jgi:proteasome lid subunit RPN8/RPN11
MLTITDKSDHEQASVLAVLRMRNADDSIYSFRIDSNDLIRAYQEISSRNRELVGIFHSHASQAYPSLTDRKYMELNPVVWLIYSTLSNQFAAYIVDDVEIQIKLDSSLSRNKP